MKVAVGILVVLVCYSMSSGGVTAETMTRVEPAQSGAGIKDAVIGSDKLFEFHEAFWANLHHFLYVEARARMATADSGREAVAQAKDDLKEISSLSNAEQTAWNAALDYYQQHLATQDLVFDDALINVSTAIARQESVPVFGDAKLDPGLVRVLNDAAPVYRKFWWPRQDEANRRWYRAEQPLLEKYEEPLSRQVAAAFRAVWPSDRLPVYLCGYSNWSGAYTTNHPSRITLGTMSKANAGADGLEILFHESLHTMDDVLDSALSAEAERQHKKSPRGLGHAVIFFTAGEFTHRAIPDHIPYAESRGIWTRGDWGAYKRILDAAWLPYLDGKTSFEEAIKSIVSMT
ncbi:MAG TPA: hypothetical protein VJX67_14800 [Blastocatellia bacterium]|nr:hypothetical protein [Blastocatellia bacterium]